MITKFKKWFLYSVLGIGVAFAAGPGVEKLDPPSPLPTSREIIQAKLQDSPVLAEKYAPEGSSLKQVAKADPKDKIDVRIGNETDAEFTPSFELKRWDGEARLRLVPILKETVASKDKMLDFAGGKMEFKNGTKEEMHFYDLPVSEANPEGAYEIEWVFNEKPLTNKVEFQLETDGLDFFYQPELTAQEIADGDIRPENVVGSYAVYTSEQKINYVGQKEYKTGKVGHIYRPKVVDAEGTEVWGILHIENSILSVEVPQDFLDKAVYPVKVDPTFGYTTAGTAGILDAATNENYASLFTSPSEGTVSKISLYISKNATANVKGIIWLHSTLALVTNGVGSAVAAPASFAWIDSTLSVSPSLSNSTEYLLGVIGSASYYGKYDNGAANTSHGGSNNYTTPTTFSVSYHSTKIYSIYATYTATMGNTTAGGSQTSASANYMYLIPVTAPADATVNNIVVRTDTDAYFNNSAFKGIITDSSFNILTNGIGDAVSVPGSDSQSWYTSTFATPPSITSGSTYYIGFVAQNANLYFSYAGGSGKQDASNSYTTPTNPTDAGTNSLNLSVYANLTLGGGGGGGSPAPARRIMIIE